MTGKDVLVGIRPEHIQVVEFAEKMSEGNTIKMPVDLVEHLGSETLLHLRGPEGAVIVARVDPRTQIRHGEVATLAVNTEHLHVFDPTTEEALTAPASESPVASVS